MANPYLNHLLDRVHSDLKFLSDQQLLSVQDLELIKSKLDSINRSTPSTNGLVHQLNSLQINQPQQAVGASLGGGGTSSASVETTKGQCKAVWNYTKSQPDDLGFQQGDIIDILEEVNADWWKGSLRGETGLFPSNHVERIQARAPPPPPPSHVAPYNVGYSQPPSTFSPPPPSTHYGVPPPPPGGPQYAYQQPQNYSSSEKQPPQQFYQPGPPPPPQHYGQPPPPPPQNVMISQAPMTEEEKKKKKFPGGQLGKTVGHAFAGGAGFGVGSALTSNAINAIF